MLICSPSCHQFIEIPPICSLLAPSTPNEKKNGNTQYSCNTEPHTQKRVCRPQLGSITWDTPHKFDVGARLDFPDAGQESPLLVTWNPEKICNQHKMGLKCTKELKYSNNLSPDPPIRSTGTIFNNLSPDYHLLERIDAQGRRVNRRTNWRQPCPRRDVPAQLFTRVVELSFH